MKHKVAITKYCDMRAPHMEITTNSNLTFPIMHINNDPSIGVAGAGLSTPDVVELQSDAGVDDSVADLETVCEVDCSMVLQRCRCRTIDVVDVPKAPTIR